MNKPFFFLENFTYKRKKNVSRESFSLPGYQLTKEIDGLERCF